MGVAARRRVIDHFTDVAMAQRYSKLYEELLAAPDSMTPPPSMHGFLRTQFTYLFRTFPLRRSWRHEPGFSPRRHNYWRDIVGY